MKRWARISLKILGGLVVGGGALWASWAAFNNRFADDAPRPVPEALRVPPAALPAERNAMYALLGMSAGGVDPQTAGLSRWALIASGPSKPEEPASTLSWPGSGANGVAKAWNCDAQTEDCIAVWSREAEGLRALLKAHAEIGQRCEAIAQTGMAIEEPLIEPVAEPKTRGDLMVVRGFNFAWRPAFNCLRWLQVRSVLASQAGDRAAMLGLVKQADALTVAMLEGTRSLTGVTVAGSMARRHWHLVTELAAHDPKAAPELRAMLRPMSPRATDVTRWIQTESRFNRRVMKELSCEDPNADLKTLTLDSPVRCESRFWAMPNATQHLFDEQWLQASALGAEGPLGLVDWKPNLESKMPLGLPRWRNSTGYFIAAVGMPGYVTYVRKQASVLLVNEAARVALAAADIAPAQRADWLKSQAMDARLRERLSIVDGQVVARPWDPIEGRTELRYAIPSGVTSAGNLTGSRTDSSPPRS